MPLLTLLNQVFDICVTVIGIYIAESKTILFPKGIVDICVFIIFDFYAVNIFTFL